MRFIATVSGKIESQDLLVVAVTKGPMCRIYWHLDSWIYLKLEYLAVIKGSWLIPALSLF